MYPTMLLNMKSEFEDWKIGPLQPGVLHPGVRAARTIHISQIFPSNSPFIEDATQFEQMSTTQNSFSFSNLSIELDL